MIQYLLNATVIWAICLLVYEAILKGETYHQWNRFYLILSVMAGLAIPLVAFDTALPVTASTGTIIIPIHQMVAAKQTIVRSSQAAMPTGPAVNWLMILYLAGVLVSFALLVKESMTLLFLYRGSNKEQHGAFTIVETGRQQAPFSFLNLVFIGNRCDYEAEELNMILQHEYRHGSMRHSFDLVFLRMLQAGLWFHPLVYHFKKRLQLVHEYQADEIARDSYREYGTFLLEQNLLHTAPTFAHSFHHSPIKNRIVMLTKNFSSRSHLLKYLVAVPLIALFMVACTRSDKGVTAPPKTKTSSSTNKVVFRGNEFEMSPVVTQHLIVKDPATGHIDSVDYSTSSHPLRMNGELIYGDSGVIKAQLIGDFSTLILNKAKDQLAVLPDGAYSLSSNNLVVSKKGKAVYYEIPGLMDVDHVTMLGLSQNVAIPISGANNDVPEQRVSTKTIEAIFAVFTNWLDEEAQFVPAMKGNIPVLNQGVDLNVSFIVKNHEVTPGKVNPLSGIDDNLKSLILNTLEEAGKKGDKKAQMAFEKNRDLISTNKTKDRP